MFCVKLKPLASNKCTLVPASMKGIHHPLTNAKMSKCSSPLLAPLSGPVLLLAGHRKSGFLSPISPTSSSSPSLEIVMMHTTNTVFKKIESIHLIFTLYKKETETETGGGWGEDRTKSHWKLCTGSTPTC